MLWCRYQYHTIYKKIDKTCLRQTKSLQFKIMYSWVTFYLLVHFTKLTITYFIYTYCLQ